MPWYHVRCRQARIRGAIGTFQLEYVRLEATDPKDAEAQYRKQYETLGPPVEVEWMEIARPGGRPHE